MSVESREYQDVFRRIGLNTICLIFLKRKDKFRIMFCTRSIRTMEFGADGDYILDWMDGRCNEDNGNIGVWDLEIGEARCFNVERLIDMYSFGELNTKEEYDRAYKKFLLFKDRYYKQLEEEYDRDISE